MKPKKTRVKVLQPAEFKLFQVAHTEILGAFSPNNNAYTLAEL